MHTTVSAQSPESVSVELLALGVGTSWKDDLAELDERFDGNLIAHLEAESFDGGDGHCLVPAFGHIEARSLLVLGTGNRAAVRAAGQAGKIARTHGHTTVALALGDADAQATADLVEALSAGNYVYDAYKPEDDRKPALESATVLGGDGAELEAARIRGKWQGFVRDLVNAPPAELYPASFAARARELEALEHVTVEVIDFEECKKRDMVGIVAVGQGSDKPGCLIHLTYDPPNAQDHIALVGKGVTFDAGGYSLKPSKSMQTMRCDMGGGGTVLGATGAIAELGLPVKVDTFIGAVENLVSGNAFKLGDVLRYRNGVTVEIHNTDAEGRLVLADCLIEASKVDGVSAIVDLATLTGACVVALGNDYTALFTDDDDLASALSDAAASVDEGMWRLPLHAPYKRQLKAKWGKIKNIGGREAGSITAALYLQHFVDGDIPWAHMDIAGSAFYDSEIDHYVPGGTGQVTRTLARWVEGLAN